MRNKERIDITLEVIREAWNKNPDLRLMQLLLNTGASYHTEESQLASAIGDMYGIETFYWGTRGLSGTEPLKYIRLDNITLEHIENILATQHQLSERIKRILLKELISRK